MTGFSSGTTSGKLGRLNQASKKPISCNLVVFRGQSPTRGKPSFKHTISFPLKTSIYLLDSAARARGHQVKLKTSKAQVTLKQALRCGSRFTKFLNKMPELN